MKISQHAKKMAKDLELSDADAAIMELKSLLYERRPFNIRENPTRPSPLNSGLHGHGLPRISNRGENSISIDLLLRIIVVLEKKIPFRLVAA